MQSLRNLIFTMIDYHRFIKSQDIFNFSSESIAKMVAAGKRRKGMKYKKSTQKEGETLLNNTQSQLLANQPFDNCKWPQEKIYETPK